MPVAAPYRPWQLSNHDPLPPWPGVGHGVASRRRTREPVAGLVARPKGSSRSQNRLFPRAHSPQPRSVPVDVDGAAPGAQGA